MVNNESQKPKMKLQFFGGAGNVTGSSYVLEYKNTRVLIDCGLYQERELQDRNWEPFPFNPRSLTATLLTHGHLDHCGLIPKLFREGFKGKLYSTKASLQIAEIIMNDSAKIQEEDAISKIKRHKKQNKTPKHIPKPLYTSKEVEIAMRHTSEVSYNKKIKISPDLNAEFINTGHIIGSAAIKFSSNDANCPTILFSGDIGRFHKPILQDPTNLPVVDYMVTESTYGAKEHIKTDIANEIKEIILEAFNRNGKIIIPSFAIERTQELLYYFFILQQKKEIPILPIFIDSPMAAKAITVFENNKHLYDKEMLAYYEKGLSPFQFEGLNIISSREDSKKINSAKGPAIIIAGSGMCTGGRIKHHLAQNIQDPSNFIVFVGYQANGTLGRQILEGNKEVRIFGDFFPVKATIKKINGLSAHADRSEIISWLKTMPETPKKIFITHGEDLSAKALEEAIKTTLNWQTYIPKFTETHILE